MRLSPFVHPGANFQKTLTTFGEHARANMDNGVRQTYSKVWLTGAEKAVTGLVGADAKARS